MKVNFSIITIVAILFGTSMTTTTNTVWAAAQVKIGSVSCDKTNVNVQFSWSGFPPDDTLELNVSGDKKSSLFSKPYDGTNDGSGSGEFSFLKSLIPTPLSSNLYVELNAGGAMDYTGLYLPPPPECDISEEHKK